MNQWTSARPAQWLRQANITRRLLPALTVAAIVLAAVTGGTAQARTSWSPGSAASAAASKSAGGIAVAAAASSNCVAWTGFQPPPTPDVSLAGVAVLSACNAWAVGNSSLIDHWNGAAWTVVAGPTPGSSSLTGVAATSGRNAWAVGINPTVILRWNGTAWKRVPIPAQPSLFGVAATSARNAWAVGSRILHWNGTAWQRMRTPALPGGPEFLGVAAASPRNVWAVGDYRPSGRFRTLIEHWNGTAWKHVPSPNPGTLSRDNFLSAVTVISSHNAWAVGRYTLSKLGQDVSKTIILHWNGTAWRHVASPNPGWGSFSLPNDLLTGVTAISPSNAWAVGIRNDKNAVEQTLVEHWNGTAWKRVRSPIASPQTPGGPAMDSELFGVAATSARNLWAVGQSFPGGTDLGPSVPLALHCC